MSKILIKQRPLLTRPENFQGVSTFVAQILARRGVASEQELELKLKHLLAPSMKGLPEAIQLMDQAIDQQKKIVIVGDYDTQGLADWVTMPNVEAVRTAVGALLDSGCRRIALIGGTAENACPDADRESRPETTSTMRTRGYVLAHEERGLQVDWRLVRNADWVQSGGRDAVAGLLDDPDAPRPDAVMCLNDALAIGVIHELQRRGVRVPQDMQVIGFDNVPDAEYCMPGLTTIDPHVDDYARHAVDMLIARIEGSADPFRTYVTSYDLVRRASTC